MLTLLPQLYSCTCMRLAEVQRQGSEGKLVGRDHGCQGVSLFPAHQ